MILAVPASSSAPSFETLLTLATQRKRYSDSRNFALDHGVDEMALLRYANGAICDGEERRAIEHVTSRNKWSRDYVVRVVKEKRKKKAAA